jgi:porin
MTAKYSDVFTNSSLGWPAILSLDLPSGGPSPPLAALGMRLRADVSDNLTLMAAVFDGDAAGPGLDDPQLRDRYGVNFRIYDPPLLVGEAQFLWNGKKATPVWINSSWVPGDISARSPMRDWARRASH